MKRISIYALFASIAFCQSAVGQTGYGVMGVPPPPAGYGTTANVPAYPNAVPPSSVSSGVTAPPGYTDPYASAPQPGGMSSYAPQGASNYTPPPTSTSSVGASSYGGSSYGQSGPNMVNFNNLEAYYRYLAPKSKGLHGASTIGATLTVALFNPLYLKFGASWGSGAGGGVGTKADYDFASIQAGVGFHTALINDKLTFVAEAGLSYASLRAQNSALSFSDGSIYVRPALRYTPLDWLELQAGVTVSSADKYDSKMLDLTAYFRLLPMFDVGVGGDFGDTTRAFRTTLRLRW